MNKYIKYIIGLFILGLGISLTIQSDLGAGPWDLLAHGQYLRFGMSVGFWQNVNYLITITVIMLVFKTKFNYMVFVPGIILGLFIDGFLMINFRHFLSPYPLVFLGTFLCSVGIIIYVGQAFIPNAIDYLMLTLHQKLKLSTGIAKLITDFIPLVFALILGIYPNVGTLITFIFVPVFMTLITKVTGYGI